MQMALVIQLLLPPNIKLSLSFGQNYLGCVRREFSQKCNWWESGFLLHLEHTPIIFTHFQCFWWIFPVGKNSKPISVQMQIVLTNYSINTPQRAILCEVNSSYLTNKETEKLKWGPCEESRLTVDPKLCLAPLVNVNIPYQMEETNMAWVGSWSTEIPICLLPGPVLEVCGRWERMGPGQGDRDLILTLITREVRVDSAV